MAAVKRFKQELMYGMSAKKVVFVERFKQESIYGMSAEKVAVVERWPLQDVRLYSVLSIS